MTARPRQLKLGAVTMGAGGPGQHYLWLDPEIPDDASVNVNWYIEQARLAEEAKFDLIFIVDSQFITPTRRRTTSTGSSRSRCCRPSPSPPGTWAWSRP
jgi:alkanesulfonate monooxygenase SsuD/methylene tetrahydromethanopterin reductase-like flavin-dependent oxidoreductase (luciferase family)